MTDYASMTPDQLAFHEDYLDGIPLPWGWNLIDDIPVPPFEDCLAYQDFLTWLQRHIALIDQSTPSLSTLIVTDMLQRGQDRYGNLDRQIHLSATELAAVFMTNLPVRWTVETIAPALTAAGMSMARDRRGVWRIEGTSTITARPGSGGDWHATVYEPRGTRRCRLDEREFLILLMQQFLWKDQGGPPCPFGWALVPSELQALIPNAIAARLKYAHDVLSPMHIRWMRDHTIAYTQNPAAIDAESEAEIRRLRALALTRAREEMEADAMAQKAAMN